MDVGDAGFGPVGEGEGAVCSGMGVWRSRRIGGWSRRMGVAVVVMVGVVVADWIVCAVVGWRGVVLPVRKGVS